MTTLEILKKAQKILTPETSWTVEKYAKDKDDNDVSPLDDRAVCFCSLGAIARAAESDDYELTWFEEVWGAIVLNSYESLAAWNDDPERTHAEVLVKFDEAIARLSGGAE